MSGDTLFMCHYKGRFVTYDGVPIYTGGEVHTIECEASSLLKNMAVDLDVSMYGQRIWYKLPFEDMTYLKLLLDGSNNFEKMCRATIWTKEVDIFMEDENIGEEDDSPPENSEDNNDKNKRSEESSGDENIGEGDNRDESSDEENGSDDGLFDVEIGGGESRFDEEGRVEENIEVEVGGEDVTFEEDVRVEAMVAGFIDNDEDYNYHDTPENSDIEEVAARGQRVKYELYKEGSGELKLSPVFDSIKKFKAAVIEYVLKEKWNVKYKRWGKNESEVRCNIGGGKCPFKVYCSYERSVGGYMIKTFIGSHNCTPDQSSKVLKDKVIAKLYLHEIRLDRGLKPKYMQNQMVIRYNLNVSHNICRKAKSRALKMLQKEHDEQFSRLKDYKKELLVINPGSTVEVGTISVAGGLDIFNRFYVCFETLRRIWTSHCRPIFGIDGCFLKCDVKGQLLAAVGRDANNQFYPVAWAIVQVEDKESWLWFIEKLQSDLGLGNGEGCTLISNRQKGLLYAVGRVLPKIKHKMCARHIYGNLRSKFPGKTQMKKLFWAVAESYNSADYEKAKKAMESYDLDVYKAMLDKNPEHCTCAYFKTTSKCEDVHNNFSESYNNSIDKARVMPLVEMLETIRRRAMVRIDLRKSKSEKHQATYTLKVATTIAEEIKKLKFCTLVAGDNGQYEVRENGVGYAVALSAGTCKCRRWDITGIPCRHALKTIFARKFDPEKYISEWYLTSKWRAIYSESIKPVNGMHFGRQTDEGKIQPPQREVTQGPTKKQKRIKGKNESPQNKKGKGMKENEAEVETKVPRPKRLVNCANCGYVGHNAKGCRNPGVRWKSSYRTTKRTRESTPINDDERPSQSSKHF